MATATATSQSSIEALYYRLPTYARPYLSNGDVSHLKDEELEALEDLEQAASCIAREEGATSWHWDCYDDGYDLATTNDLHGDMGLLGGETCMVRFVMVFNR